VTLFELTPTPVRIVPRTILRWLIVVIVAFTVASLFGQYMRFQHGFGGMWGFVPMFDMEREANIPTLFNSHLLLAASLLLVIVARMGQLNADRMTRRWWILGAIFALMSVDEIVSLHEYLGQRVPDVDGFGGIFFYAWVIPATIFVILVGLYYLPLVRQVDNPHRRRIILAGLIYIGSVIGVEFAESAVASRTGDETMPYQVLAALQESGEMLGAAVFIWALLHLIASRSRELRADAVITDQ